MCGICGFVGKPQPDGLPILRGLNDAQTHRGPDAAGVWISSDKRVGFAHRRLSIIDLTSAGNQPMFSASGRYVITFNGEIYNFRELRAILSQYGHRFRGTSDTEVLLAACEEWGVTAAVSKLNGMFAAAVWDDIERSAYLFRDRLGLKPLYYRWSSGTLFFSSEMTSAFAQLSGSTPSISRDAIALLFRHGYVPGPRSIYETVRKLLPGTIAKYSMERTATEFDSCSYYWETSREIDNRLALVDRAMTEQESLEFLDSVLRDSVRDHMVADVPLGAFLSGGIDSSLIVAYMQSVSNAQVRTFTIGFDNQAFNEARYARRVAEHLGTAHTELTVSEEDALQLVPRMAQIYGEPFADSSQIPTYFVSRLARDHVTVALSGDGGDELFAGYNMYRQLRRHQHRLGLIPENLIPSLSMVLRSGSISRMLRTILGDRNFSRALTALKLLSFEHNRQLIAPAMGHLAIYEQLVEGSTPGISTTVSHRCGSTNLVEQLMYEDLTGYLPDDILVKVDRASMAVSLEVRAPFADDYRVFDAAWRIPFVHKTTDFQGKMILRGLLQRFIPAELIDRPKTGFAIPLLQWMRGALREWVEDCVSPHRIRHEGFLAESRVQMVRQRALAGDPYWATILWSICQFESWLASSHSSPDKHIASVAQVSA